MKSPYQYLLLLLFPLLFLQSCQDQDDTLPEPTSLDVQKFIWRGLNQMYLWQEDVPDLADKRFASNAEYENFLESYSSPEDLFENLLNRPPSLYDTNVVDKFSWIVSDYLTLEQQLGGTTKNNGVEFGLSLVSSGSDQVIGYVRYIIPNSDAATKDIKRGEVFYAVNGTPLNLSNYSNLLFSADENYTLNFANLTYDTNNNPVITPNGKNLALTKTSLAENPIFIKKVINSGAHKIGYLMYNGFYPSYDSQLNDAFAYFKSEGITDLVLDLRYNGGGSVLTATRLASMISGQFNGQVFSELAYNNRKSYLNQKYLFTSTIDGTSLSSLNLTTVYVLTTKSTASASELIINGLDPYINVVQIGDATYGKNVASVTLYDSPTLTKTNRNPSHRYAMQPIVAHSVNAVGFGDYLDGLIPDYKLSERIKTLGVLGDPSEPLLSTAIGKITGTAKFIVPEKPTTDFEYLNDSKTLRGQNQMYFE
ncbi:S41 family peptidase [Flavobacterium undicola]|uniref:S41 family peptidase n=1 Tax=Flavobacterium undicola TaxID=1932779 RepID=UPI0013764EF7|nr:S41 family peptidase [Flavobacterium undicola]MBA0884276.1 peptidase S41 [Flavobacterium undicola]